MTSQHHHEHGDHDHGHGHDGHDHSHDLTPALQSNLYKHIEFDKITTLNEVEPRSGAAIVQKAWTERLEEVPELQSDADEQLLMYVPYVQTQPPTGDSVLISCVPDLLAQPNFTLC